MKLICSCHWISIKDLVIDFRSLLLSLSPTEIVVLLIYRETIAYQTNEEIHEPASPLSSSSADDIEICLVNTFMDLLMFEKLALRWKIIIKWKYESAICDKRLDCVL